MVEEKSIYFSRLKSISYSWRWVRCFLIPPNPKANQQNQNLVGDEGTWKPPPNGYVKENFDASLRKKVGTGIGVIYRDNEGQILVAASKFLTKCSLQKKLKHWCSGGLHKLRWISVFISWYWLFSSTSFVEIETSCGEKLFSWNYGWLPCFDAKCFPECFNFCYERRK